MEATNLVFHQLLTECEMFDVVRILLDVLNYIIHKHYTFNASIKPKKSVHFQCALHHALPFW